VKKNLLFSGALLFAVPFFGGCPNNCGNGVIDAGEACDDGNNDDGDVCSAVCTFEGSGTDYRLSSLVLLDDLHPSRFGLLNGLIQSAINTPDPDKAMNVIIQFNSTTDGNTAVLVGPGTFAGVVENKDSFIFTTSLNLNGQPTDITPTSITPTTILDGVASFQGANVFMPVEAELNSGIFAPLLIRDAGFSAKFDHKQLINLLFKDVLSNTSTLNTTIAIQKLCALNIFIDDIAINLLDAFDDGSVTLVDTNDNGFIDPEDGLSSITPGPQRDKFGAIIHDANGHIVFEEPTAQNCQPCGGDGANVDIEFPCVIPENNGPDGDPNTGDDLYNISATFGADGRVVITPLP
jgi:cysteine-rich repeat protein